MVNVTDDWGERPSIMIFGDRPRDIEAARRAAESVGGRVIGSARIDQAIGRLDRLVTANSIMVELDDGAAADRDALLIRLNQSAREGALAAIVSMPVALIDEVIALIDEPGVTLLCDPTPEERVAALGLTLAERRSAFHDQSVEPDAERLRRLSEEVARIAGALAELSTSANAVARAPYRDLRPVPADQRVDADTVRGMIRLRRLREQFFPRDLFADPAWDMLLDLMAAKLEGEGVAVSSLCIAAAVPATTALRWIRTLTEHGLFVRRADPEDGRRIFIELSDAASEAMSAFFHTAHQMGVRLPA